jgi:hypothetical protein
VVSGLKRSWPKNLTVRKLYINGSLNVNDIENLSSINGNLELDLDNVPADDMYQLLEHMGRNVKTLDIGDMFQVMQSIEYIKGQMIILERILAACPNLENFVFHKNSPSVVQDDRYDLLPSAFKNYKE